MRRVLGRAIRRQMAALDAVDDADRIARLSLVTLNGHPTIVYALFTVAFMKQVAVPTMARILYRRGTGDIVRDTLQRNDDTIVFFGQLLDHGPTSDVGRAWIERLNQIHAHFPLRNEDSLYTLSTLALDPHQLTADLGSSPFSVAEREAHWGFWRAVAEGQHLQDLPTDAASLKVWAEEYEVREFAPTEDGRAIATALIDAFGRRCLPAPLRRWDARIIASLCPAPLRRVHDLPDPGWGVETAVRVLLAVYVRTLSLHPVPVDRSLAFDFGERRHGLRGPQEVGHRWGTSSR